MSRASSIKGWQISTHFAKKDGILEPPGASFTSLEVSPPPGSDAGSYSDPVLFLFGACRRNPLRFVLFSLFCLLFLYPSFSLSLTLSSFCPLSSSSSSPFLSLPPHPPLPLSLSLSLSRSLSLSVSLSLSDLQSGEFAWDSSLQGVLLSSFAYGYTGFMLFGGFVVTRFGARRIIFIFMSVASMLTLLSPLAASTDPYLLVAVEAVKGIFIVSRNKSSKHTACYSRNGRMQQQRTFSSTIGHSQNALYVLWASQ